MRTADEIIKEKYPFYDSNLMFKDVELNGEQVSNLINTAIIECIKECAETMYDYYDPINGFNKDQFIKDTLEQLK